LSLAGQAYLTTLGFGSSISGTNANSLEGDLAVVYDRLWAKEPFGRILSKSPIAKAMPTAFLASAIHASQLRLEIGFL
jgi:hypothetical protein